MYHPIPTHDSRDFWNASPFNSYVERRARRIARRQAHKAEKRATRHEVTYGNVNPADTRLTTAEATAYALALPEGATSGWLVLASQDGSLRAEFSRSFLGTLRVAASLGANGAKVLRTSQVESLLPALLDHQADLASGLI